MSTDLIAAVSAPAVPTAVTEYVTCRAGDLANSAEQIRVRGVRGAEVFMDDVKKRTLPLWESTNERDAILSALRAAGVARVHASYWAAPTAFVANVQFGELVERFGGIERVREYFGDINGAHMFSRWRDEYALARELGAAVYVFHLIDYMPVDGAWAFTIDRQVVLDAMVVLTQQFLRDLDAHGLIDESSPLIELENAGWGLEFGAQTADDFVEVFAKVHDRTEKLRIGWDINHLLHAVGLDGTRGVFLLPDTELTSEMREIERQAGGDIRELSKLWIERTVLDPRLIDHISAIHVSDCPAKNVEYFRNGVLDEAHAIDGDWDERKAEGLRIVLEHYDNHAGLGDGVLDPADIRGLIAAITAKHPLMILHELKNAPDVWAAVDRQRAALWATTLAH